MATYTDVSRDALPPVARPQAYEPASTFWISLALTAAMIAIIAQISLR